MPLHRPLNLWRLYRALQQTLRTAVGLALRLADWEAQLQCHPLLWCDTPRERIKQSAIALSLGKGTSRPPP